ncbi:hypothetical protein CKQ90_36620, partial [Klebsiella pneumoniae]
DLVLVRLQEERDPLLHKRLYNALPPRDPRRFAGADLVLVRLQEERDPLLHKRLYNALPPRDPRRFAG